MVRRSVTEFGEWLPRRNSVANPPDQNRKVASASFVLQNLVDVIERATADQDAGWLCLIRSNIADQSIGFARTNAQLNHLLPERCRLAADAAQLFQSVIEYDPEETVVVLDPTRKGCGRLARWGQL